MSLCSTFLFVLMILFTALDLAGFWVCREDREGFRENILLVVVNIGTVAVVWAI